MTTPSALDVDLAVRSVLAAMSRRDGRSARGVEAFAGRLLSASRVEALAPDVREVHLTVGTVVTPIARDLLKRRGIALKHVSHASLFRGRSKGAGEWAFATEGRASGVVDALRRALLDAWLEIDPEGVVPWILADRDRGALLLTDEASVAAWRANRLEGIRAASACDPEAVARAVRALGVNLLVVEPSGHSIASLRAMAEAVRRGGAPGEPEGLR